MEMFKEQALMLIGTPIYLILIVSELLFTLWTNRKSYALGDTGTNIVFAAIDGGLDILLRGFVLWIMSFFYSHPLFHFAPGGWVYWLGCFFAQDFAYYVMHCADHKIRFFWAVHVTHHSSLHFNLTTGFRSPVLQPFYRAFFFAPVAWLGFQPVDVLVMYAATQFYGSFVHTEHVRSLGFLEWFMVTPSHHRVHHASNPKYLDKNMGMCLIIWDKIFGTFQKEDPADPPRYGLTKQVENRSPLNLIFHEWKEIWHDVRVNARNWRERFGYIFGGPGWKPKD